MAKNFKKPRHQQKSDINKAKESIKVEFNSLISFSFKYFVVRQDKFDPYARGNDYFTVLVERLREISRFSIQQFYANRSQSLRSHPIDWEDTSENSFGIPSEDQIVSVPYQFELSANEYGRVHGFIIESVFYIRWLDPDHNLYE